MKEYFEFRDEKSDKFWEIDWPEGGCALVVRYGKCGSAGSFREKIFNTSAQAQAYCEKQKSAKQKKGYVFKSSEASSITAQPALQAPPLAEYLCSPSEASQQLGVELAEHLLKSDPDAIDVPALMVVACMDYGKHGVEQTPVQKQALALVRRLPKPPKELGGWMNDRHVRYICENGSSQVISRMIAWSLNSTDILLRGDYGLCWFDSGLRCFPKELGEFKDIVALLTPQAQLSEFPEVVIGLPNLKRLDLRSSKISYLPETICQMKQLESIDMGRNLLAALPDNIGKLEGIEHLSLDHNQLRELPESMAHMTRLQYFSLEGNPMDAAGQVVRVFKHCFEHNSDVPTRRILINLMFARNRRASDLASVEDLLTALNMGFSVVRVNALAALSMKCEAQYLGAPLSAGCQLAVVGKTGSPVNEIAQRLADYGVEVGTRISKSTTHILVGEKPGKKSQSVLDSSAVLMTEVQLQDFLRAQETPFFLDEAQDTADAQEHIIELLLSDEVDSQRLALEMLKRSGVSPALKTPLFFCFRLADDKVVRELAKVLLLQDSAPDFVRIIHKNQDFRAASEKAADRYMNELAALGVLDVTWLSQLCCQKRHIGLNYFFIHAQQPEVLAFLATMLDEAGVLDLSGRHLHVLPSYLGELPGLRGLKLSGNELRALPTSLHLASDLLQLDVSNNKLSSFPQDVTGLHHLDLSDNRFKVFPAGVLNCNKLVYLDVGRNSIKSEPKDLSALPLLETFHWR